MLQEVFSGQSIDSTQYFGYDLETHIYTPDGGSGHTCLGLLTGKTEEAWSFSVGTYWSGYRSPTLSTATKKYAAHLRLRMADEAYTIADGHTVSRYYRSFGSTDGDTAPVMLYVQTVRSGTNYILNLQIVQTGQATQNLTINTLSATADHEDFLTLDLYIFLDKVSAYLNGSLIGSITYGAVKTAMYSPSGFLLFFGAGGAGSGETDSVTWHLFTYEFRVHEVDLTGGTLTRSLTNGNTDEGEMLFIKKTAIDTLVAAATDAFLYDIADGDVTEAVTHPVANEDYLCVKVVNGNTSGYAVKLNIDSSGNWTLNNWSFA